MLLHLALHLLATVVVFKSRKFWVRGASLDMERQWKRVKDVLTAHLLLFVIVGQVGLATIVGFRLVIVANRLAILAAAVVIIVAHVHEQSLLVVQVLVELQAIVNSLEPVFAPSQHCPHLIYIWT